MAPLDTILLLVFSIISVGGIALAVWCFRKALKVSDKKDGDFKMFLWAVGTMFWLVVAGMCTAYILLPILFNG
jgi:hypothetical protein